MARRATHLMPQRFTKLNVSTMAMATASTGSHGKYHCWRAEAESSAVSPQVGNPAPPIAGAGQRREHRAVRPEGLGAGGGDAADAVRPHQDQLGPSRRRGPAEEDADDQQGNCGAALPENGALADEQRRDQEDHLVAAAHGKRGRAKPTEHPWMGRRNAVLARRRTHEPKFSRVSRASCFLRQCNRPQKRYQQAHATSGLMSSDNR